MTCSSAPRGPNSRRRPGLRSAGLVGLLALGLASVPHGALANSSYAHWSQRDLVISDRTGDPGWQLATQRATQAWNNVGSGMHLTWREGGVGCDPQGSVIPVCRDDLPCGDQALTDWYTTNGYLSDAVVRFDATRDFPQPLKDTIACHELGHVVGLNHATASDSCLGPDTTSASPNADDASALRSVYPG